MSSETEREKIKPSWIGNPDELERFAEAHRHSLGESAEVAEAAILDALKIACEYRDSLAEAALHRTLLQLYREANRIDEAIEQGQVAVDIASRNGFFIERTRALTALGASWIEAGNPATAFALLSEAEATAREHCSNSHIAEVLIAKGASYGRLRMPEEALQYSLQVVEQYSEEISERSLIRVLGNMSACLNDLERYNESLVYVDRAIALHREISGDLLNPFLLGNRAVAMSQTSSLEEVLALIEEVEQFVTRKGRDTILIASLMEELGVVYLKSNQIQGAIECLVRAKARAQSFNSPNILRTVSRHLADAYRIAGELDRALEELDTAYTLLEGSLRSDIDAGIHTGIIRQEAEFARRESDLMREAKFQADRANRAKTDFIGDISHELRTPLNGVLGMVSILLETDLTTEQLEYADLIRVSGDALLSVVGNVLDISEIESGKLTLESKELDIVQVCEDIAAALASRAHEKGVEINVDVDAELPDSVVGDEDRFRQILTNLIGNAIKFTETGEIILRICDAIKNQVAEIKTKRIRIEVVDSGIGIADDRQRAVFDSFTQADSNTRREYGGTGLGLAICRRLVEKMNGEIGLVSQLGFGSTFWVEIDFDLCNRPQLKSQPQFLGQTAAIIGAGATLAKGLGSQLASAGFDVASSDHPKTIKTCPDLVFIDLDRVPNAQTEAAALKSRFDRDELPVVYLSMIGKSNRLCTVRNIPFSHVLLKPIRRSQLFRIIRDALPKTVDSDDNESQNSGVENPYIRVLIAEDNLVNQMVAARMFERLGMAADLAENGQEAVERFSRGKYDFIFMDCQMPVMDGYAATRAIRQLELGRDKRTPVIAMTANSLASDREACISAGMDDFLSKPITDTKLREIVGRWVTLH